MQTNRPPRAFGWACALTVATVPVARGTTYTVSLLHDRFEPSAIVIRVGDTVNWVWVEDFHNVESGTVDGFKTLPDGRFRSGDPNIGLQFTLTFDAAFLSANKADGRVYPYYCVVHASSGMVGAITVAECLVDADCVDTNPCTDAHCNAGVCALSPNSAACDDANPCTSADTCGNGLCAGSVIPSCCRTHGECNDGNVCTADFCENGGCRASPISSNPCDDGNPCTDNDACNQGQCTGTPRAVCCTAPTDCDDADPCTIDRCVAGVCVRDPSQASCDDNDPCTSGDICSEGQCRGTVIAGCCESDEQCKPAPCREASCVARRCRSVAIDGCETCDDDTACDDDDACTDDRCMQGECRIAFNEAECDDGDTCTINDVCQAGNCTGQARTGCCHADHDCDDQDLCTDDTCVDSACVSAPVAECELPDSQEDPPAEEVPTTPADDPVGQELPRPRLCGVGAILAVLCCSLIALATRRRPMIHRSANTSSIQTT